MDTPNLDHPDVKLIAKGAAVAFGAGVLIAMVAFYSDPGHYTLAHLRDFWPVGLASGVVSLGAYLKRSPVPQWLWERAGGVERRGQGADVSE